MNQDVRAEFCLATVESDPDKFDSDKVRTLYQVVPAFFIAWCHKDSSKDIQAETFSQVNQKGHKSLRIAMEYLTGFLRLGYDSL